MLLSCRRLGDNLDKDFRFCSHHLSNYCCSCFYLPVALVADIFALIEMPQFRANLIFNEYGYRDIDFCSHFDSVRADNAFINAAVAQNSLSCLASYSSIIWEKVL